MSIVLDDLALERFLKENLWDFKKGDSEEDVASQVGFKSGGWLTGYSDNHVHTWRVKAGAVELLSANGTVTSRLAVNRSADGQAEMAGPVRAHGEPGPYRLKEAGEAKRPRRRTALIVPIHDLYFHYGITLLFQSIGADYDIIFVFSTDSDRMRFREMHQASSFLEYHSIILDDHFSGSAISGIAARNVWPSLKKFLAISLSHKHYDYLLCVDAETFILKAEGWTAACENIVENKRWYGGALYEVNASERFIMHASSMLLAPTSDHEKIQAISQNWSLYTWWWDLPVYSSKSVPGFLDWIGWEPSLQFVEKLNHSIFDHITYQFYMALHEGFSFLRVNGVTHTLEFCGAKTVVDVHNQINPVRWVNALAYAQNPNFFKDNDYLAFYHIDRKSFPAYNPS